VHGGGELAITREDDFLTVSLDAPLANFGLSETKVPEGAKAEKYAEGIVEPIGPTVCEETERSITGRTDGTHGAMTVSVVWRCKKIDRVEGMLVHVFDLYPAFEHIDAIYLGPDGQQVAKELTPKRHRDRFRLMQPEPRHGCHPGRKPSFCLAGASARPGYRELYSWPWRESCSCADHPGPESRPCSA
jgi:hypothetical protein